MRREVQFGIALLCLAAVAAARPDLLEPPKSPFQAWLPKDAQERLNAIQEDHSLPWEEKRVLIDEIFEKLPADVLAEMPFPPGFNQLPKETQDRLKEIHSDSSMKWRDRVNKAIQFIDSLPEEQRRLLGPPLAPPPPHIGGRGMGRMGFRGRGFPSMPPPGFENVLPKESYEKLLEVHGDLKRSEKEKKEKIDAIMSELPQEVVDKLPLPPNFDRLPEESVARARSILHNFTVPFDERHQQMRTFIDSLPEEQRRLIGPPMPPPPPHMGGMGMGGMGFRGRGFPPMPPPGFKNVLPKESYEKLMEVHGDLKMSEKERKEKIDSIMSELPQEVVDKLPLPPRFDRLPEESVARARSILHNFTVPFDERHRQLRTFIDSLPEEQRWLVMPGPFRPGPQLPPQLPPEFKQVLPAEVYEKLDAIHHNIDLSWRERSKQMSEVLKTVSKEILDKLPVPPPFRDLSEQSQQKIREILQNFDLDVEEKRKQVRELVESLPEEERGKMRPWHPHGRMHPFPMGPPPEFKDVLPAETWTKLTQIHADMSLSPREKRRQTEAVMKEVPHEILLKLPLPPPFRNLPEEAQNKLHEIFADTSLQFMSKFRRARAFVRTLPEEQRRMVLPSPPMSFQMLPLNARQQIEKILDDEEFQHIENAQRIGEIMNDIPAESRDSSMDED